MIIWQYWWVYCQMGNYSKYCLSKIVIKKKKQECSSHKAYPQFYPWNSSNLWQQEQDRLQEQFLHSNELQQQNGWWTGFLKIQISKNYCDDRQKLFGYVSIRLYVFFLPKLITATAWTTSSLTILNLNSLDPLMLGDVWGPSMATVTIMMTIATRANALVFANFEISL